MKRTNRILSMILGVAIIFGASSCKEDAPVIGGGDGTIAVADGFYITQTGVDPVSTSQLVSATVDGEGFTAMAREGFVQNYVYLTAGSYNVVEVTDKTIVNTFGGTVTTVAGADAHNPECDESGYNVVTAALDGDAFSIATDGLYTVSYDATLSEIIVDQITSAGIIGGGTPGGWSSDTDMPGSVTADGGSWTVEGVTLDVGEMKFRFNCRWAIDRRIDTGALFDNANGYTVFTNYGGSVDNLQPGNEGANIQIAEYAVYTVVFTWSPTDGAAATLTRTGDAVPKALYPDAMYLVGAGTAYGWATPGDDTDANYVAGAEMHKIAGGSSAEEGIFWKILYLEAGQGFKISAANWGNPNLGFGDVSEYDVDGVTVSDNGGNMDIATSGMYMVVLNLQNDMKKVSIVTPEVYGIGDAFGGWDEEMVGAAYTIDNTAKTITSPAFTADATAVRSYVNHAWITAWWNAEFLVNGTTIEYRNDGGDPTAVAVTAGQVMTFSFDDNSGTIQ